MLLFSILRCPVVRFSEVMKNAKIGFFERHFISYNEYSNSTNSYKSEPETPSLVTITRVILYRQQNKQLQLHQYSYICISNIFLCMLILYCTTFSPSSLTHTRTFSVCLCRASELVRCISCVALRLYKI